MPRSDPADTLPLACVVTELDPGGAELAFVRVVGGLAARGWSPHVYPLRNGPLGAELDSAGVQVSPGVSRLGSRMRRQRPAAVLSFLFHANLAARFAAKLCGSPPVVCGVRVAERRRNGHRTLDRLSASLVDRWVCVGENVRRFSVDEVGLPADRVVTIPNGVDAARWANAAPADRAGLSLPEDARVLLFAGRLSEQKDPHALLAAFAALDRPGAILLVAGDGPLRGELEQRAGERARFLGRRDDLPNLMRLADAFVLPSRWEGTPNVLLEAAAAGTPVVATAVDGTAETFAHGETARLVPVGEAAGLADELRWVLDRPAEAAAMAERAKRHVLARHDWEATIDAYDALLRGLVAGR